VRAVGLAGVAGHPLNKIANLLGKSLGRAKVQEQGPALGLALNQARQQGPLIVSARVSLYLDGHLAESWCYADEIRKGVTLGYLPVAGTLKISPAGTGSGEHKALNVARMIQQPDTNRAQPEVTFDRPYRLVAAGYRKLVIVYGVRGRLEAAAASRGLTPFVGREDELRLLMSRWERALDGEGQVALIIGEAGIGKSRLLQRFHEQIGGTPHSWIEAGAGAFFQNTPFYPVTELLRQFLGGNGGKAGRGAARATGTAAGTRGT
jgi:AAA ATPase domain